MGKTRGAKSNALVNFKDIIHVNKYLDTSIFTVALSTKHKTGTI